MDPDVRKELDKLWMEVKELKKEKSAGKLHGKSKRKQKNNYKGLAGGVRFLIDNGFFDSPKNLNEIINELKREGYHYSKSGIASTLSETFVKNQRILNRIKENKSWSYALRK
jgi:hypothetical protein